MFMQKALLGAAAATALALGMASAAAAATTVPLGTLPPSDPYFFLTSGGPTAATSTANFGATVTGSSTAFDDVFTFSTLPNYTGSGSVSTSFTANLNQLTITKVVIAGVDYTSQLVNTASGQSLSVGGVVLDGVNPKAIEIAGVTAAGNVAATYTGTATLVSAAPEPAAWLLMLGGVGMIGGMMRRRRTVGAQFA